MNKHMTESYSADYFSTCMHLAAISLKNESYSGLVYLPIRCVIISVFWGWNKADHTPPSLRQQLLAVIGAGDVVIHAWGHKGMKQSPVP